MIDLVNGCGPIPADGASSSLDVGQHLLVYTTCGSGGVHDDDAALREDERVPLRNLDGVTCHLDSVLFVLLAVSLFADEISRAQEDESPIAAELQRLNSLRLDGEVTDVDCFRRELQDRYITPRGGDVGYVSARQDARETWAYVMGALSSSGLRNIPLLSGGLTDSRSGEEVNVFASWKRLRWILGSDPTTLRSLDMFLGNRHLSASRWPAVLSISLEPASGGSTAADYRPRRLPLVLCPNNLSDVEMYKLEALIEFQPGRLHYIAKVLTETSAGSFWKIYDDTQPMVEHRALLLQPGNCTLAACGLALFVRAEVS
jgi:hypothetical protein